MKRKRSDLPGCCLSGILDPTYHLPGSLSALLVVLCVTTMTVSPAFAQTDDEEEDENIVLMQEFTVDSSGDTGYTATNAVSGTILRSNLKDTAVSIDVFNEAFIKDTGSTDIREQLAYDSGLIIDNTLGDTSAGGSGDGSTLVEFDSRSIQNSETDVVVRGFRAPTLQDGFFTKTRVDTIGIARIERVSGASSLLYGIGALSGITNVLTKRPIEIGAYEFEAFVGSDDFYRFTADVNGPELFGDSFPLRYRVVGAWQTRGWTQNGDPRFASRNVFPFSQEELRYVQPAFELRPFESTSLLVYAQIQDKDEEGVGIRDITDPDGTRTDEGRQARFLEDTLGLGPFVNLGGPDAIREDRLRAIGARFEQNIGNHLTILVAGTYEEFDRYQRLPALELFRSDDSLTDPATVDPERFRIETEEIFQDFGFGPVLVGTRDTYESIGTLWTENWQERNTKQFRATIAYSPELFGGVQSFVAGRQDLDEDFNFTFYTEGSELPADTVAPFQQYTFPDGRPVRDPGGPVIGPEAMDFTNSWLTGHYLIYQGNLFWDRVRPMLGYRWERVATRALRGTFPSDARIDAQPGDPFQDPETIGSGFTNVGNNLYDLTESAEPLPGTEGVSRRGTVAGYSNRGEPLNIETATAGLSVTVTEALSVYGVYSEGIGLPRSAQTDGNGDAFAPDFTRSREVGIKFAFFDGKVSGRFNAFRLDKFNEVRYSFYVPNPSRGNFDPNEPITYAIAVNPSGINHRDRIQQRIADGAVVLDDDGVQINNLSVLEQETVITAGGTSNFYIIPWSGNEDFLLDYHNDQIDLREQGVEPENTGFAFIPAGNNPGLDRGAYHTFDQRSEGYEVRLDLNLTEAWSQKFSYTYTDTFVTRGLSGIVNNQINTGLHPVFVSLGRDNFTDATSPSSYVGELGVGQSRSDTPVHAWTYFTRYNFLEGFLEGTNVRLGLRYQGERIVQDPFSSAPGTGRPPDAIERTRGNEGSKAPVPSYMLVDVGLGYEWEMWGVIWSADVFVRNLFEEDIIEATRLVPIGSEVFEEQTSRYYLEPRDVRFSLRASF